MGLDVYKLKIDRNYNGPLDAGHINDLPGYHVILKAEFQEFLGTKDNKNLNELFEYFKDSVKKVLVYYYDLDFYNEKFNTQIDRVDHIFPSQIPDYIKQYNFTDLKGKYKNLDDLKLITLLIDKDDNLIFHTSKDIKKKEVYLDGLIFTQTAYQRSCDKPDLYDRFYGDCWYKKDDTGLSNTNVRWFVFAKDLAELKECFIKDSAIQSWDLYSSEVIYLNP